MLSEKQLHLLSLCQIEGLNWHLLARQAQRPQGLDLLLKGELTEISKDSNGIKKVLRVGLKRMRELETELRQRVAPARNIGAKITTVLDDDYPLNLRRIYNLPPFLFYFGQLMPDDVRAVAVVGTRHPSKEGLVRSRKLASMLAREGVTVLSGLALGIDTAAHEGTLAVGGRTIAVMGTGICQIYPTGNKDLATKIIEEGGALVSQFWPLMPPASHTFPRRNITMSGMGQGTVVIEASATSGAKMQARLALEHGKKVFLLKSLVQNYEWARKYLDRGAIQVDNAEAIIEKLVSPVKIRQQLEDLNQLSLNLA